MASKLPYFPFYPDDWLSDEKLRLCSLGARGLWTDLLCLMHKCDRRGYLQQANGQPFSPEQIARIAGCSADEAAHLLRELIDSGAASVTEHGILYSRRMTRDEHIRQVRSEAGKKGGNPALRSESCLSKVSSKTQAKGQAKLKQNAGSGYGSESGMPLEGEEGGAGEEGEPRPPPPPDPFDVFWEAYPRGEAKKAARRAWDKLHPDEDLLKQILEAIARQKLTDGWIRGFAPHAATWLNGERWKDDPPPTVNGAATQTLFSAFKDTPSNGRIQ